MNRKALRSPSGQKAVLEFSLQRRFWILLNIFWNFKKQNKYCNQQILKSMWNKVQVCVPKSLVQAGARWYHLCFQDLFIYFNYLNQTTWQNVNPRKFIIFGIKYCTDILLTSGCFSWENRNWFIWGSCWQMTYRKLNYSQHQNHKNEPFCSEERILSLAMPKPAFIDRNGWEHIVLSQNPVYQVIHRWYPGHIPDSLEMTKPRLFLAQGKFLNVCIFETGVCGHPVSWQWIALARNSPVAPFCPPLHPTPEGLCYQGGTNEHCKYKSEKKRRISHLSSNFLCFVISEGASGVFFSLSLQVVYISWERILIDEKQLTSAGKVRKTTAFSWLSESKSKAELINVDRCLNIFSTHDKKWFKKLKLLFIC